MKHISTLRRLVVPLAGLCFSAPAAMADEPPSLPLEVRQIQQDLGGPAADQFPSLRAAPAADAWQDPPSMAPAWGSSPSPSASPDRRAAAQVAALRDSAAELDMAANRLETLELYRQSDALRTLAQRLRLGAREMLQAQRGAIETPPAESPRRQSRLGRRTPSTPEVAEESAAAR